MSKLIFTFNDFSPRGIEKYRADLERRAKAVGVIGPHDSIEIDRYSLEMVVEHHTTHLDGMGYTIVEDTYAVPDVKRPDVKRKRWWRR